MALQDCHDSHHWGAHRWGLINHGFNESLAGTWLTMRWLTGLIGLSGVAQQ